MAKTYLTQAETIVQFKAILTNAKSEPVIAEILADFGYDDAKIKEGEKVLAVTEAAVASSDKEEREKRAAYADYQAKYRAALDTYALDRRKARVTYRHEPEKRKDLGLHHATNVSFAEHVKQMKAFYGTVDSTTALAVPLQKMKIDSAHIKAQLAAVTELELAVAKYKLERGESEDAIKAKAETYKQARAWMSDFLAVAKIALEERKDLWEALKKVK